MCSQQEEWLAKSRGKKGVHMGQIIDFAGLLRFLVFQRHVHRRGIHRGVQKGVQLRPDQEAPYVDKAVLQCYITGIVVLD